jgi:probable F420-dependent oxidoreductase
MMKPFRFGVNVWSAGSRAEWADKARKAEELGYDVFTVPDRLAGIFAPMPALMSAAAATKRLRVGTNVLNNDFRHPVLVAREAATADLLTDGRLQVGLGAGHMKSEYDEAGLRFDAGGARVERLAVVIGVSLLVVPNVGELRVPTEPPDRRKRELLDGADSAHARREIHFDCCKEVKAS